MSQNSIDLLELYLAVIRVGRFHYKIIADQLSTTPKQTEGRWYFEKRRSQQEDQDWRCILFKFVEFYCNQQLDMCQDEIEETIIQTFKLANSGKDDQAVSLLFSVVESRARLDRPPRKRKIVRSSSNSNSFSSTCSGVEGAKDITEEELKAFDQFIQFGFDKDETE